mgnify:CR=1 FL=1
METKNLLIDHDKIIKLERSANKDGIGIVFDELIGKWKFKYVWKKGSDSIDNVSSSLLQVLEASLELCIFETKEDLQTYEIQNSIRFGIISIVFKGKAFLKGTRPLLYFYFQNLIIKLGSLNIFTKAFQKIELKKMPFFSLIFIDKEKKSLHARGKGGGLAIWIK